MPSACLAMRSVDVEGIYNRHTYDVEKADALKKLAALIEQIVV